MWSNLSGALDAGHSHLAAARWQLRCHSVHTGADQDPVRLLSAARRSITALIHRDGQNWIGSAAGMHHASPLDLQSQDSSAILIRAGLTFSAKSSIQPLICRSAGPGCLCMGQSSLTAFSVCGFLYRSTPLMACELMLLPCSLHATKMTFVRFCATS